MKKRRPTAVSFARASAREQHRAMAALGTFIANRIRRGHPELRGWSCVTVDGDQAYGKCQQCGNGVNSPTYRQGVRLFRRVRVELKTCGYFIISGREVCALCMREEVEGEQRSIQNGSARGGKRLVATASQGHRPESRERSPSG